MAACWYYVGIILEWFWDCLGISFGHFFYQNYIDTLSIERINGRYFIICSCNLLEYAMMCIYIYIYTHIRLCTQCMRQSRQWGKGEHRHPRRGGGGATTMPRRIFSATGPQSRPIAPRDEISRSGEPLTSTTPLPPWLACVQWRIFSALVAHPLDTFHDHK